MKSDSIRDTLEKVERHVYNMDRYKEFREHYENYRSQIGVLASIQFTLREMKLDHLMEKM